MTTKWEVLVARRDEAQEALARAEAELAGLETTPFGHPCGGCGKMLATEADFAKHFTVPDTRYLNLGWCPVEGRLR